MSGGPASWPDGGGTPVFGEPVYLDGVTLQGSSARVPLQVDADIKGATLETLGGTDVEQLIWLGGDIPINMHRRRIVLPVKIAFEADYWVIQEAADTGKSVPIWFDWAMTDRWYIPGNDLGTTWKFSRQLPYNLVPGIDQSARPPKAWLEEPDGTQSALTVVTGTPATGEIQIPDSDGYETATTFAGDADAGTYQYLKVRYHPMLLVRISRISFAYQEFNSLVFNLDMREHRGGLYTLAPGE